jgi:hypothetical protein
MTAFDIVIGKSKVKRILARHELGRNEVSAGTSIRIIVASIIVGPVPVPGAAKIGHGVVAPWALADPEDRCDNVALPTIPPWPPTQSVSADHWGSSHKGRLFNGSVRMMLRVMPDILFGLVRGRPMMLGLLVVDQYFEVATGPKASITRVARLRRSLPAVTCENAQR